MSVMRGSRTSSLIRGQGVNIFWGGLSLFFAAAAVYFYWQYVEYEQSARVLRDQEIQILQENQQLRAQVDKLQESIATVDQMVRNRDQKLRDQQNTVERAVLDAKRVADETAALVDRQRVRQENAERIREKMTEVGEISDVSVVARGTAPIIRIENAVLFKPATMELTEKAPRTLQRIAQTVGDLLDTNELHIEAFTDSDPITGSMLEKYPSNYDLAAARASVVARFLVERTGLPADRVVIVSRGPNFPVQPNTTPDLKAQNRRVEFVLAPAPQLMRESIKSSAPAPSPAPAASAPPPAAEAGETEVIEVQAVDRTATP